MATGMSPTEANALLDQFVLDYPWIQLHTADPGVAGATAVAGNSTRKQPTWAAASGGSVTTSADINWTDAEVDTAETYTFFTLFSLSAAGVFGGSGTVTANAVASAGDSFSILAGGLTLSFTVAA